MPDWQGRPFPSANDLRDAQSERDQQAQSYLADQLREAVARAEAAEQERDQMKNRAKYERERADSLAFNHERLHVLEARCREREAEIENERRAVRALESRLSAAREALEPFACGDEPIPEDGFAIPASRAQIEAARSVLSGPEGTDG